MVRIGVFVGLVLCSTACLTAETPDIGSQGQAVDTVETLPAPRLVVDTQVEPICRSSYVAGTATLLEETKPAEGPTQCRVRMQCQAKAAPAREFFPASMMDADCLAQVGAACAAYAKNDKDYVIETTIIAATKPNATCADLVQADYDYGCEQVPPVPATKWLGEDLSRVWAADPTKFVTCSMPLPSTPIEKACGDASANVVHQSGCKVIPTAGASNFYLAESGQGPGLPVVFRCDWVQRCDRIVLDRGDVIGPPGETESCRSVPRSKLTPKKMCDASTLPAVVDPGRTNYFSVTWYPDTSWLGKLEDAGTYYAGPADGWIRRTRDALRKQLQASCDGQAAPAAATQTASCTAANPTTGLPKVPMICCPDTLLK